MVITTILAFTVMRRFWGWSLPLAAALTGCFLAIDGAFLAANLVKVADGGWFPLLVGAGGLLLMTTWRTGRHLLVERLREQSMSLEDLKHRVEAARPARVPGTAIYMTRHPELIPAALLRLLRVLNVLHEHVIFLTVLAERVPRIETAHRVDVQALGLGFFRVTARYGFLEQPNVPQAVRQCRERGLVIDSNVAVYVLSPETLIASPRPGMALWREKLFAFMARNSARATGFYRIPPAQVLEVGGQIEL
jgi:KUP system potassium uptake protein